MNRSAGFQNHRFIVAKFRLFSFRFVPSRGALSVVWRFGYYGKIVRARIVRIYDSRIRRRRRTSFDAKYFWSSRRVGAESETVGAECDILRRDTRIISKRNSTRPVNSHVKDAKTSTTSRRRRRRAASCSARRPCQRLVYGAARQILRRRMFQINAVGDLERWNRRARLRQAVALLRGRAQAEYRAMIVDGNDEVEWDDFRQFMQRTFGPQNPLQHYTRALVANRQGKQESVSSYSSRFRNVLLKLQTIDRDAHSAAAIVLWYTEGLRSELQAELERDAPETLEEAVKSPKKQNEFGSGSKVRSSVAQTATRSSLRRYRN